MNESAEARVFARARRALPVQDWNMIQLIAQRFLHAQDGMRDWAVKARECVDFYEGRQWSEGDIRKLIAEKRPMLTINKILPLVNLVVGYHLNNQTQDQFLPGHDGSGSAATAAALSMVTKQIDQMNDLQYIDTEVFLDGLLTGRGYYDSRLDFRKNALGNVAIGAVDPFTVYVDPEAASYDLNTGNFVITSRKVSIEDILGLYGHEAAEAVVPLLGGQSRGSMGSQVFGWKEEITPWRNFGGDEEGRDLWSRFAGIDDWVDRQRKTVMLFDMQGYQHVDRWVFVDMDTGDQKPIPDEWDAQRIERVLMWSQANSVNLVVQQKTMRRLRWTHMIGDTIVFDSWSPYETMTLTPFFPYFRRGMTKGMVEPLIDSQREINVRRSARQNIIGRSSNSGWKVHEGSMTPEQLEDLENNGGSAGFILKYKTTGPSGTTLPQPEQITPQQSPISVAQLEGEAKTDIEEIAGINKASLGQVDQSNVSGRAILARQQQTVIGLEGFIANYHRSKRGLGRKKLELIQSFMTEPRIVRVMGKGHAQEVLMINQRTAAGIANDVSLGNYEVSIDETSLSDSFLEGQFRELMTMKQAGMPIPDEFLIDASSLGRKDDLKAQLAAAREQMAAQGVQAGDAPGAVNGPGPGGSAVDQNGGSLPA
ncbi:hypothetical protein UFOVP469_17 [uncultured Caudovirales phage]|uniref:Head-to-tail connector protein, podovirus-type n=1 Tax=uncultured Caudovirales phage TaxID=2100421 RepID=A0A6J5MAW4_9CAUD|nr:hypothetical protein UFOVP469_17 [uncultured Caudovirales phage]CAB4190241.1 hypothetical protein UFOVP1200_47 [uncultured Caudovirales phage]